MALFEVSQLSKAYDGQEVVRSVSFSLESGRCIALLGPNGAGKTTILKMLAGLSKPTRGQILFKNHKPKEDLREHIGYLSQYPVFYDWMTGKEFLEYVGQLTNLSRSESTKRATELLELVGITEARNRRISKYSGGMKQRLGIAQAILHRPKLLLLDEPVSALDPFGRREVLELIKKLKEDTTILFSTHVLNDAEEVSDDVLILHHGELKVADNLVNLRKMYQNAVIILETEHISEPYFKHLQQMEFVSEVIFEGNIAKITVNNLNVARDRILQEIVLKEIPIQRFEIGSSSLEDLFVKVVRG